MDRQSLGRAPEGGDGTAWGMGVLGRKAGTGKVSVGQGRSGCLVRVVFWQ